MSTMGTHVSHDSFNDYETAVENFLTEHRQHFSDPTLARINLLHRLVDDEMRAVWMDGLLQTHLHLRFLWGEIFIATLGEFAWSDTHFVKNVAKHRQLVRTVKANLAQSAYQDTHFRAALDAMDFPQLVGFILNTRTLAPLHALAVSLGIYNVKVLETMLANLLHLYLELLALRPYQRIKGFRTVPMSDAQFYNLALIADKEFPDRAKDGSQCATAALVTFMDAVPMKEIWFEKYRNMTEKTASILKTIQSADPT